MAPDVIHFINKYNCFNDLGKKALEPQENTLQKETLEVWLYNHYNIIIISPEYTYTFIDACRWTLSML